MSAVRRNFGAQGGFQEAQVIILGRVQPGRGRDHRMIGDGDLEAVPVVR